MPIHAAIANAFSRNTSSDGKIHAEGAKNLVKETKKVNDDNAHCCGSIPSKKGDRSLEKLIHDRPDKFDDAGKKIVNDWLKNHQMPSGSGTATSPTAPTRPTTTPTTPTSPTSPVTPTDTNPVNSAHGKVILEWKSGKPTWHCHWFPMLETQPGGDVINNFAANGGIVDKYVQAFGGPALQHERANNVKPFGSDKRKFGWFGHCNFASQAASVLKEPKRDVTIKGANGQPITFTAHDISGLLCKVVPSLTINEDFEGQRYNGPNDDPRDPRPSVFLKKVLQAWGKNEEGPFVLDTDPEAPVWNYPFDQGRVYESDKAPAGFDTSTLPSGGKVKFYRAEVAGTDFPKQAQTYAFWIQYDASNNPMQEGYFKAPGSSADQELNPDFAWRSRPIADLSKKETWVTNPKVQTNNPFIKAEDVYPLYMASIA